MKTALPRIALATIAGVLLFCSSNINWGKEHWRTVLQADAKGYYAYLPAIFIHHDPNFGFFDTIERGVHYNPALFYDYRTQHAGRYINKYFLGTAVAQLPFFLIAHAYAHATDGPADGYSKPYVVAVNLAAIAWTLLGLFCLWRLLASYGIADRWIAVTVAAFTFGTNLFYYVIVAPGMSHAYSFGLCCAFLLTGHRLFARPAGRTILLLGGLFGLIVLIRPVNGLILLALPIMSERTPVLAHLRTFLTQHWKALLAAIVLAISIMGLQLLYYKVATGDWLVYSYGEEGFRWSDPHIADILFSYKKGLFLYTPLLLLAIIGWPFLHQRSAFAAVSWAVFFFLLTYVLSSWWIWWYGGSFGSRVYVEYLGLFALLAALALQYLPVRWRRALLAGMVMVTILCQIQTYQMRYYQIHWEDMDRDRYWEVFLRVDRIP